MSTVGGAFSQKVVEAMSRINERPVILALSNPTSCAECTSEQAYTWSKGKALYAAGVPMPPVHWQGTTFVPGQANNFYIFPAVGLAIYATKARRVTDSMFIEAAHGVADQVTPAMLAQASSIRRSRTSSRPRSSLRCAWRSSSSIWALRASSGRRTSRR